MNLRRKTVTTSLSLLALLIALTTPAALSAKDLTDRNLGFLTPVDFIPDGIVQVLTTEGEVLYGVIRRSVWTFRGLSRFTLIEADGRRTRFKAEDVVRLSASADLWTKVAMVGEAITTIEKASNTDYSQIENVNELIFDAVAWPDESNRVILLRVNHGFDQNFQVYSLTNGKEGTFTLGGIPAFGNEKKSYVVAQGDSAPVKIKKKSYRKQFETLYGDCPQMLTLYKKKARDFSDFANHIAKYDQVCSSRAAGAQAAD